MFRFVESRYGSFNSAMARVLMSRAEWENGLSPANRWRYQYTKVKSKPAG
jgi:hypothetical protein